jgi:tRNA-Thr(GGU) m(6)t(6)A37 methyltransferase TsaA
MIKKDPKKPFSLIPIGVLHTPFKRSEECLFQGARAKATGEIVLDKHLQPALKDLDGVTHLFLLTFMHLADRKKLQTVTPHGPEIHGTFATRSPHRPNPIGLSVVRLMKIKGADSMSGAWTAWMAPLSLTSSLTTLTSMPFPVPWQVGTRKSKDERRGKRLIRLSR